MSSDGTWTTPLTLSRAGSYRVFADFKRAGRNHTLASDLAVDGPVDWQALPEPITEIRTPSGYDVSLRAHSAAGGQTELAYEVRRAGKPVDVEPYLGARGHLVALREHDLAYLHVHPLKTTTEHGRAAIGFATTFETAGRYRLFLQFKHAGRVRTAAATFASSTR